MALVALTLVLGALAVAGLAQADGPGCTGTRHASACTPCDGSEWHVHVFDLQQGTGIYCFPP